MIEYIKQLFSKGYIYLGLLFFVDDVISFIFNKNISLPDNFKYIILIFIVLYATYKVWKNERDEKLRLYLIVNGEVPNLSVEAEELLNEAVKFGKILETEDYDGLHIQIDKKSFTSGNDKGTIANYKSALNELFDNNFIDEKQGMYYKVSAKGYKYIQDKAKQ